MIANIFILMVISVCMFFGVVFAFWSGKKPETGAEKEKQGKFMLASILSFAVVAVFSALWIYNEIHAAKHEIIMHQLDLYDLALPLL